MADLFIFLAGLVVTSIVGSAVFLLMWGAAHEPAAGEPFEARTKPRDGAPKPAPRPVVDHGVRAS